MNNKPANDRETQRLLGEALKIIITHGTRSEEIRDFVREHRHVGDLPELVASAIMVMEMEDEEEGTDEAQAE